MRWSVYTQRTQRIDAMLQTIETATLRPERPSHRETARRLTERTYAAYWEALLAHSAILDAYRDSRDDAIEAAARAARNTAHDAWRAAIRAEGRVL